MPASVAAAPLPPAPGYGRGASKGRMHTRSRSIARTHVHARLYIDNIMDKFTEQKIKDAAGIVDVISDFLTLKKKGVNYQCLCPFHEDKHIGSFVVHPARNCYVCFSCEAKGGPIDFLMNYAKLSYPDALRYLATKYGIPINEDYDREKFKNIKPAKQRDMTELPDNRQRRTWPTQWIGYYKNLSNDNFVNWLRSQPWDACQRARLEKVLNDYHVGHVWFDSVLDGQREHHEWTMWWMLDEQNILHNCHMMKYRKDGHRDKTTEYNQTWLHARMRWVQGTNHFDEEKEQASYCLFGQHLLNAYPTATVNIVESEKTAVIMATAYGNHATQVWMACCGMQNLKRERLQPLIDQGRKIQLFPDRDGIKKWVAKANEISYSGMMLNTTAVKEWWQPQDGEKADIADVVLRIINDGFNKKGYL